MLAEDAFFGSEVVTDLLDFKTRAEVILANRHHPDLDDVLGKVFTRDFKNSDE